MSSVKTVLDVLCIYTVNRFDFASDLFSHEFTNLRLNCTIL